MLHWSESEDSLRFTQAQPKNLPAILASQIFRESYLLVRLRVRQSDPSSVDFRRFRGIPSVAWNFLRISENETLTAKCKI